MEDDKIVISGMGVFTSYGRGIELLRRGLLECKRHLISLKNENTQSCNVNLIFDNTSIPNNCIEMLTLSINEALEMACLSLTGKNRTALIIGTGTGNINYFENCIFEDKDFDIDKFCCGSENLLQSIANKYSIDSVVSCISTGCSSSNYALSYASSLIKLGKCDKVICCGIETISYIVLNCFNKMNGADPTGIKPFDKKRLGSTAGAGSGVLIIEKEKDVLKRNITPLAEIGGYGYSCDGYNVIVPQPNGMQITKAMKDAIENSNISLDEIAAVYAHGTGTKLNDSIESHALDELLGECFFTPPVVAMKGNIGHTGGASNILAACAAILSFQENLAFKTMGTESIDEDCRLNVTINSQPITNSAILINGFAFGGNNASLILKRYINEN